LVLRRRWLPAVVLVVGSLITVLAAWTVNGFLLRAETADAGISADRVTAAVRLALDRAAVATRAVRAMYAAGSVTNEQFVRFSQTLATSQSASAVGFVRRIEHSERPSYEGGLTAEPGARLGIWENDAQNRPVRSPDRPVYFVVESALLPGGAQPPVSFDVGSLADRADAIRRALDRFQLSISGEIELPQLGGKGIVLFDPVVDGASRLIGVATASLTHADLQRTAAQTSGVTAFTLRVGAAGTAPPVSSSSGGAAAPPAVEANPSAGEGIARAFPFADRLITIAVSDSRRDAARPWIVLLVVGLGLAATSAIVASLFNGAKSQELRTAERRLRAMLDGLGPIALLLAPDGTVINANRAALTTFRRSEDEMVRRPFAELVAATDEAEKNRLKEAIAAATRGEDVRFDLKLEAAEGRQVYDLWIHRQDMSSDVVASAVDVTDRYEAEETQRLLMRELDHRMKNTLQVIQAIIRRTATTQESIAKFEQALLGRVGAMSRAHDLLARERWHGAEIAAVIGQETEPLSAGRAIVARGPSLRLSPKAALSLALVIHELATNAVKYGALSTAEGKVDIRWEVDRAPREPRLVLRWQESDGPAVAPARHRGFGSLLIERSIAYELDGSAEVDYRREGLICTIVAPLRTVRSFAQLDQGILAAS
jgi:PAS domain S-box-containing protein